MRHDDTPLRNRLYDLEAKEQAADERYQVAKRRQQGDAYWKPAREVTAALRAHRDLIEYHKPGATPVEDRPARERELTEAILDEVRDRGFLFSLFENSATLQITDPSIDAAAAAAEAEARAATRAVKDFVRENAAAMEEESRRANDAEFKAAIDAGDTEAVRGILGLKDKTENPALTSGDLS